MLHAVLAADAHRIQQGLALAFAFFHVLARAQRGLQYFNGSDASSAILTRNESLRNDVAKALRQAVSHRVLFGHGEDSHDSLHRLRRVDGVQRGEHQVTRFRRFHGDLDGFAVAHLSHKNHFRSLAQRRPQGQRKARRIGVQFALMDNAVLVGCRNSMGSSMVST